MTCITLAWKMPPPCAMTAAYSLLQRSWLSTGSQLIHSSLGMALVMTEPWKRMT